MANALQPTEIAVRLHGDCAANYKVFEQVETFLLVGDSTANAIIITVHFIHQVALAWRQRRNLSVFELPPALLSTTHGGGHTLFNR